MNYPVDPEEIKYLVLNSKEPVVFKNKLNWELLQWDLNKWAQLLKGEELLFRCGRNSHTKDPQWERTTRNLKMTFENFLSFTCKQNDEWVYFDYKYLKEWFDNMEELHKAVSWENFGFPNSSSKDSTIWIGSKGAHTPCHIDTYGCNLIAQIYGKKQWIVFPPEEDLKLTRIPYEESSIYSKLNFFSPSLHEFKGVGNCRKIVLHPGDVLFLPHRWWHYVENLETAISINVWLPLLEDDEQRLSESLVQLFVSQISRDMCKEAKEVILNPNSDKEIETDISAAINLVNTCKDICNDSRNLHKKHRSNQPGVNVDKSFDLSEIFKKYTFLQTIPKLSADQFKTFLEHQSSRFDKSQSTSCKHFGNVNKIVELVNAITHPDVISLITEKLLK